MNFEAIPLWGNIAVFAAGAVAVWIAGTRMAHYADDIRERSGISEAMIGLVVLGVVTSLPEIATSVSGAIAGNPKLVLNNALGGLAMQVAILAVADAVFGRDALSSVVGTPMVLLQGALCILLLCLVIAGILVGDTLIFGIGAWCWLILLGYFASVWIVSGAQGRRPWVPGDRPPERRHQETSPSSDSHSKLAAKAIAAAAVVLVAGYLLTRSGEVIATQTGVGSSFFGAVFLAISTSLPEVSTVLAAVRLHRYEMAISDIFGTNLIDASLPAVVDLAYAGEPVLSAAGNFSALAALLGIAVTAIYLVGLIERRDRTVLRLGYDSAAVIVVYLAGLAGLYVLR